MTKIYISYNDNSLDLTEWTTDKLKNEAQNYDCLINTVGCFGARDLGILENILKELTKRGVAITTKIAFD